MYTYYFIEKVLYRVNTGSADTLISDKSARSSRNRWPGET